MKRSLLEAIFAAASSMVLLASPVLAHGGHDAQPLARNLTAGPFTISLWQLYADAGVTVAPHVVVMFDSGAPASQPTAVTVTVNSASMEALPSPTTPNGWDTTQEVMEKDVVSVTISDASGAWKFAPIVVPPSPTSGLPIKELVLACILLTIRATWWVAGRTARAWRKPVGNPVEHVGNPVGKIGNPAEQSAAT